MSKAKPAKTSETNEAKPAGTTTPKDHLAQKTAVSDPTSLLHKKQLSPQQAQTLQRTIGNQTLRRLAIQRKMTLGPAGDKYEQEADNIAKQVVGKINRYPASNIPQRQEEEEEVQMKPLPSISRLQRQEEEEVQAKPLIQRQEEEEEVQMKPLAQRQKEEEEVQAKQDPILSGGELSNDLETAVTQAKSGGLPIADNIRKPMENAFNADFRNVKIHTGSQSDNLNRSISARAFTSGQDIFFRGGEYNPGSSSGQELLAHELTHTIQQGAAQTRQTDSQPNVQRQSESPLIQRFSIKDWFKKKKSGGKTTEESSSQPEKESESSTDSKKEEETSTVDLELQDAVEYERKLGSYAFSHKKADESANAMVNKMTNAMITDFNKEDEEHRKKLVELYGREKVESAGQVGTEFDSVFSAINQGNIREKLTALYNVMYGPFKQYITQAMKDKAWTEMEQKGLNVTKLKRRKRQMRFNIGAKDLYRDPGNPLDRKNFSSFLHVGKTRFAKDESSKRTVSDLEKSGIGLSDREKNLQFGNELASGEDISDEKVKWKEGGTYWAINKKNKWVQKVENSMHMPVIAGPSGSMLRMFQLWEFLNKPTSAADWRLAVLGWMLSSNDHSFHEMMMTAADYGLPYKPGQVSYMKVHPLTLWELRDNVAKNGLFPHELAFKRKTEAGKFNMIDDEYLEEAEDSLEFISPSDKGAVSGPAAAMIKLYSEFGYLLLNPTKEGGMFLKKKVQNAINNKAELKDIKQDIEDGKYTIDDLIKETKEMLPMMEGALEMLPDWSGDLFRGTGTFSPWSYRSGSSFTFGKFGSSTLDEDVAKDFADNYNKGPYKYILKMKVTAGKDIRQLASYAEDEILLPPGSKFSVKDKEKKGKYTYVNMDQTGRGGDKLDIGTHEEVIEEDVISGPTLSYYATKSVDDYYDTFTDPFEKHFVQPDHEEGEWTEFLYAKEGTYYWAKTTELNAFLNPSSETEETESFVPSDPDAKLITPSEGGSISFMSFGGLDNLESIDKPTYIKIVDENYPDGFEGWENVEVKNLETGVTGYINFTDLKKYLGSAPELKKETSSESVSESEEENTSFGLPFGVDIINLLESGADLEMLVSMGMVGDSVLKSLKPEQIIKLAQYMGISEDAVNDQISEL